MSNYSKMSRQIGLRMPSGLYAQLEAYAVRLTEAYGLKVSVSDAARVLLEKGLDAEAYQPDLKEPPKKRQTPKRAPSPLKIPTPPQM
jgi:hypothetical protein